MEKHARFSLESVVEHFDSIAVNYEDCQNSNDYPDPGYVAKFLKSYAQKKSINLGTTRILDFGCGTGLVGKELNNIGCKLIDGIDCS
jgi:predicted TPR repeat methyltransferase